MAISKINKTQSRYSLSRLLKTNLQNVRKSWIWKNYVCFNFFKTIFLCKVCIILFVSEKYFLDFDPVSGSPGRVPNYPT